MEQATRAAIQTLHPQLLDGSLGLRAFGDTRRFRHRKSVNSFMRAAALIGMLCVPASVARAGPQTHTTTTLAVTPGASVSAGVPVTLTATVTFTSSVTSGPVTAGTVVFCNANAVHCEDAAIIGTAQLTAAGSATTKVTLGVGAYSIFAAYQPDLFPGSKSANQALTVTADANYFSFTSITASAPPSPPPSPYTLTGTVAAFGIAPPTGTVTLFDVTSSSVVGAGVLDPATSGFTFVPASGSPVAVGFDPELAILGDFNNDGKLDMAVAVGVQTPGANTVSVLLGNGDGTFQAENSYAPANFFAAWILAGDFNHDGNLDLAVVISGDSTLGDGTGTVNILLGNGDGTFQPQQTYIVGNRPDSIAMADFNGDGILDLAVLNSTDDNVTVLLGVGDGTFQLEQSCTTVPALQGVRSEGSPTTCVTATFPVGADAAQIATADFNGDGFADLVVTNSGNNTVSVLLGVGDGTFQSQVTYAVGHEVHGIAVADFNGDGIPDLAVTNEQDGTVGVLLGIGDGTFQQPQVTYTTGPVPMGISVGDFKGNGNADLAVSNFESNSVSVFLNKGDGTGTFQPQAVFPGGGIPLQLVAGDLNGDGLSDLAVVNAKQFTDSIFKATILLAAQTEAATATGLVISGTQNVMATYPGDTIRAASQSGAIPVGPVATTTSLSCSPNPAFSGELVTCTATVAPIPTGEEGMSFFNGATLLGSADINSSGVATFTTSSLPLGPSSITAVFSGSTSAVRSVTVNALTVTTTTLSVAPNPATAGQLVTLTATVTPAPTGAPAGLVTFKKGVTVLGTGTLNASGVATFTTSSLPVGTYGLLAAYAGNAGFAASVSTVQSVTVNAAITTTTTLTVSPNPAQAGQPVTFTVTVAPPPTGTPLGTVNFLNGAASLGMATLNSAGVATLTISNLPSGTDVITAVFSGNVASAGSTSAPVNIVITPTFTITAPTTPITVAAGSMVTVNINVAPLGGSFTSVVTMSATGLPAGDTATFNPPSVTPGAAGATTVLTLAFPASAQFVPEPGKNQPFALFGFVAAGLGLFIRKRKQLAKSWTMALACAALMCGLLVTPGCGTTGSGAKSQTIVVTVTGTSGLVHESTTVTLILK
jgi:Bacterial Ig-like domain (group 3)/FG-GAP-like repeat